MQLEMAYLRQGDLPPYHLAPGVTVIGRQWDCDLVVDSKSVSRRHARILCDDDRWFIEDLGSRNGTSLNGRRLSRRCVLHDGDELEISSLPFRFFARDTPTELSGSWSVSPSIIGAPSPEGDSDTDRSIPRAGASFGQVIDLSRSVRQSIRDDQLVARHAVSDGGSGWPVANGAPQKLASLMQLIQTFRCRRTVEDVIAETLSHVFEAFPLAEGAAVLLHDDTDTCLRVAAVRGRVPERTVEICLPVIHESVNSREALLYVDHLRNRRADTENNPTGGMWSVMVTPLTALPGHCLGAIQLDTGQRQERFTESDLEQLVVLGHLVSAWLEQILDWQTESQRALLNRTTEDALHLRSELSSVRAQPRVEGFRIAHHLIPSPDVAGDFVDFRRQEDGSLACVVVDVPGRGHDAAVHMTTVSRLVLDEISCRTSLSDAMTAAARALNECSESVPVPTSVAAIRLHPQSAHVTVAVAGLCPITVVSRTGPELPPIPPGPAFGAEPETYSERQIPLRPGESLFAFTDGIRKLQSPSGRLLNHRALEALVHRACSMAPTAQLADEVASLLTQYRDNAPLLDDVAFLMVHRPENGASKPF